jgi:hypothetical protein
MLKLKWWLLLLLCLNAVVLAWQWDLFARWGYGPNVHREPERLKQQILPEGMKFEVLRPDATGPVSPASSAAAVPVPASDPEAPQSVSAEPPFGGPATVATPTPAVSSPAARP